jgi:predicted P-loop ATPase
VLSGTSNDLEIINDPTGNRRIVPINIKAIDFEAFNAIDKTELFMEAYRIYHTEGNSSWQLSKEDIENLNQLTSYNEQVDTVEEAIMMFFEKTDSNHESNTKTTTEIISYMMQYSKLHFNTQRVGIALRNLGFERTSKRKNGKSVKCYKVKEILPTTSNFSSYG